MQRIVGLCSEYSVSECVKKSKSIGKNGGREIRDEGRAQGGVEEKVENAKSEGRVLTEKAQVYGMRAWKQS